MHLITLTWKSPVACPDMPHPVHFIKSLISQQLFRSQPLNNVMSYKTHSMTFSCMSLVCPGMPQPLHFIKGLISLKLFRSTPIYNAIPHDKTQSITLTRMPPGVCPSIPYHFHFIKGLLSLNPFRSSSLKHI